MSKKKCREWVLEQKGKGSNGMMGWCGWLNMKIRKKRC